MLEITCLPKVVRPADCGAMGDTLLVSGIQVHDTVTGNDRTLFHPVQGEFTGHGVRLFDAYGNSISFDYSDSDKTREQLEELLEVCFCCSTPTDYLLVNNTPVGYIPSPSGNLSNLNEVITDSAGDNWIIDIVGNAKKMAGSGGVTSVNASISGALSVSGGPITTSGTLAFTWAGTALEYVRGDGSLAAFPSIPSITPSALTKTNDTNVTLTLGGTPATALLEAVSLTLGWTGILAIGRGGTGLGTLGTVNQLLRVNSGGTALEYFSPTWTSNTGTVTSVAASVGGTALGVSGTPITSSGTLAFSWTGTSGQYVRGDGVLQAFPTIPSVAGKYVALSDADAGYSGQLSAVNLNDYTKTQVIYSNGDVTNNPNANSYVVWIGSVANTYGAQMAINPSVSDKFFFRNNYNTSWSSWYQVASREWVISQNYITSGSVSVALALPSNTFDISGSPVTSLGTLTGAFKSQIKKTVLAAPWGADGTPIWRQLQPSDLQQNGATTGQVITWNGTEWVPSAAGGGYWSRSGTVLYTTTSADAVVINTATSNSALARLNVGELGYTAANYQSNIGLHQTDTYGIDKGVSISGYPQAGGPYLGVGKIGFYKENATLNNQDTYFSISTRTGASNVTVDSTKFKISGAGLVTITNIPSSSSSVNLVVSNGGTLESRTIASLAYYTAGTGISIAGPVITNTLPSKWQITGALYLTPSVSAYDIATPITGSIGYVTMRKGTASQCGYFEVRTAAAERVGYIGYQTGYMNYSSEIGNHRFNGGTVQINNIPSGSTSLNILTTNGGVVETRTIASLTGLPSSVWAVQGGSTAATTTTQDIWHNARVRIGDSTVSSFQLSVVGQAYISSGAIINNSVYYSAYASDAVATELLGITSSNLIKVGAPKSGSKSFDIYLPNYTSSRAADTMSAGDSFLFAASSGVMYKQGGQWVRNYGASVFTTADESHSADSTPRRVTFDSYVCNNDYGYFNYSFSTGDYKVAGATGQMFMVICTLEYTTSGTPTVTAQLRVGGATKETNISTSADGRKVMTIHTVTGGGGSGNFECYLTVSGSAITLKKCRLSVMPLGAEWP